MRRKDRLIEDPTRILTLLETARWGQIAFAVGNEPYAVALNYGVEAGPPPALWFHCAGEGRKLEALEANPRVCFQAVAAAEIETASEACGWTCRYESVTAFGRLKRAEGVDEKRRGLDYIMAHYGWTGEARYPEAMLERTTVLRLEVESITGKSSA